MITPELHLCPIKQGVYGYILLLQLGSHINNTGVPNKPLRCMALRVLLLLYDVKAYLVKGDISRKPLNEIVSRAFSLVIGLSF